MWMFLLMDPKESSVNNFFSGIQRTTEVSNLNRGLLNRFLAEWEINFKDFSNGENHMNSHLEISLRNRNVSLILKCLNSF